MNELEQFRRIQRLYRNPKYRKLDLEVDLFYLSSTADPDGPHRQWRKFGDFLVGTRYLEPASGTISQLDFLWLGSDEGKGDAHERYRTLYIDEFWNLCGIEPTRDLMILTRGEILRFSSLRTGQAHSGASQRELVIPEHPLILDLQGSWLLLSCLYVSPDIYLYHWPTGTRKQVRNCSDCGDVD